MRKFDDLDHDTQLKFIQTIRSFPCLWDEKSEAFRSPKKREHEAQRDLAFATLLFVLKFHNNRYRDATTDTVKELVKSFLSFIKKTRMYVGLNPNLKNEGWYQLLADFLSSQSDQSQSLTPIKISEDKDVNHVPQFLQVKLEERSDSNKVDYGCPTNVTQNRPDKPIPSSSPHLSPPASNNIIDVPDTSTKNASNSPQPKRRKHSSSSSTRTSSIDKYFGSYIMIALSKMDQDQRMKAKGKITEILSQGQGGLL